MARLYREPARVIGRDRRGFRLTGRFNDGGSFMCVCGPGDVEGISSYLVKQAGIRACGYQEFANRSLVSARRQHEGCLALVVSGVKVVAPFDVETHRLFNTRENRDPKKSVQRWAMYRGRGAQALASISAI